MSILQSQEYICMMKSVIRAALPVSHYSFLSWARGRFGTVWSLSAYLKFLLTGARLVNTGPAAFDAPVYVRPGTADQAVYDEGFVDREYDISCPEPKFIIDAGAHIGLSIVWFAKKYPHARILAIEPEESNFKLLCRNTRRYPLMTVLRAAVWGRK